MSSLRNGVKQVRVERPRPLKMGGGTQPELGLGDLVTVLESVTRSLAGSGKPVMAGAGDPGVIRQLETLAANLRMTGPQLELSHKVRLTQIRLGFDWDLDSTWSQSILPLL